MSAPTYCLVRKPPTCQLFSLVVSQVFFQRDPLFCSSLILVHPPNPCQDFLIKLRFFECQSHRCYSRLLQMFLSVSCPVALFLDSKLLHLRRFKEAPVILDDFRLLGLRVGLRC